MNNIYCIIGKSGTGKDTVVSELLKDSQLKASELVPYTTRPRREGEKEGVNYHFVTKQQLDKMQADGEIIERRSYNTVHGEWIYFTASTNIENDKNYIVITTQKALDGFFNYFGEDRIHVIYLYLNDRVRLERCISRESQQETPNYAEVCRRYLADENDFDEEQVKNYKNCTIVDTENKPETYIDIIKNVINSLED